MKNIKTVVTNTFSVSFLVSRLIEGEDVGLKFICFLDVTSFTNI